MKYKTIEMKPEEPWALWNHIISPIPPINARLKINGDNFLHSNNVIINNVIIIINNH